MNTILARQLWRANIVFIIAFLNVSHIYNFINVKITSISIIGNITS